MHAVLAFFVVAFFAATAAARPNSLLGGAVTFELPANWQVQRQGPHGSAEIVQLLIPDQATDNTPESSNGYHGEPLQPGLTIKSFGDSSVRKSDMTVLTDIPPVRLGGPCSRTVIPERPATSS